MSGAAADLPAPVQRWALLIEYDGTPFQGWQVQESGPSVQAVLEAAATRLAGAPVHSVVAGRTDSGVHAEGQVAHLDLPAGHGRLDARRIRDALNFHMKPHPVAVLRAAAVPADWNARFSATGRRYRYRILNRAARPALAVNRCWHVRQPLDVAAMAEAAAILLGRHDFTSFRAAACQANSPLRTL
ncbi:MAG: tRNA pseudouridine(38-40) synthase TruA, partial [Gluconacetobacter diazotrophicus]|nr:tRNA pseudouridine(38-40) synthase TruA [Gluconacetobacter diazotrophicus]